jgi:hypothetical protein
MTFQSTSVQEKVESLPGDLIYGQSLLSRALTPNPNRMTRYLHFSTSLRFSLLHCIEVLCLLDCLSEGVDSLQIAIGSLKVSPRPSQQQRTTNFSNSLVIPKCTAKIDPLAHRRNLFHTSCLLHLRAHIYYSTLYKHYQVQLKFASIVTMYRKGEREHHGSLN